jgi:hypothetical protein
MITGRSGTISGRSRTVPADAGPPGTSTGPGTAESGPAVRGGGALEVRDVAHLIPAARAARNALAASGQTVSRDRLADRMRDDGHGVSNARASLLLKILKAEENVTQPEPVPAASHGGDQGQVAS